ncbi:hypothetical protein I7I48_10249 [Histoplasma ohiense]|nr:hypothetical protein I7I48_10249 [Histoplasma ohiense (nom. inval.)]
MATQNSNFEPFEDYDDSCWKAQQTLNLRSFVRTLIVSGEDNPFQIATVHAHKDLLQNKIYHFHLQMSYIVYLITSNGMPRNHHALFVETSSVTGSDHIFQVTGKTRPFTRPATHFPWQDVPWSCAKGL